MSQVQSTFSSVEMLDLSKLQSSSADAINRSMQDPRVTLWKQLTHLNLSRCKVSEQGFLSLVKHLTLPMKPIDVVPTGQIARTLMPPPGLRLQYLKLGSCPKVRRASCKLRKPDSLDLQQK